MITRTSAGVGGGGAFGLTNVIEKPASAWLTPPPSDSIVWFAPPPLTALALTVTLAV